MASQLERARWAPHVLAFDHFFKQQLPLLEHHFRELGIESEHFFVDWSLTLFSRAVPLAAAARVWDSCLLRGEVFCVQTALGVLRLYAEVREAAEIDAPRARAAGRTRERGHPSPKKKPVDPTKNTVEDEPDFIVS